MPLTMATPTAATMTWTSSSIQSMPLVSVGIPIARASAAPMSAFAVDVYRRPDERGSRRAVRRQHHDTGADGLTATRRVTRSSELLHHAPALGASVSETLPEQWSWLVEPGGFDTHLASLQPAGDLSIGST